MAPANVEGVHEIALPIHESNNVFGALANPELASATRNVGSGAILVAKRLGG